MSEIKPGDVVVMKSGGPAMVVTSLENGSGGPRAWCEWMKDAEKKGDSFSLHGLHLLEEVEGDRRTRLKKALSSLGS